jgi:hypothetical protein
MILQIQCGYSNQNTRLLHFFHFTKLNKDHQVELNCFKELELKIQLPLPKKRPKMNLNHNFEIGKAY